MVSWAGLWLALPFVARVIGAGLFVLLALGALFPLLRFRWPTREEGAEPARPRHRHPPSPGDRAHRHAGEQGPGRAGAVAGTARTHAGLDQAHPRRSAFAAASDPRSLGAARAGGGDDGGGLCRRRRRTRDADCRGLRLERRAGAGQYPGRRLGDAAGLYQQASDHSFRRQQGRRRARQRAVAGSGRQHASGALERRHHRRGGRRRRQRSRAQRAGAQGHQRAAFQDRRRRHRPCPRAGRPAAMEVRRDARPSADDFAGKGSGAPGPRLAADVLQDRGRLRRHRSARRVCPRLGQGSGQGRSGKVAEPPRPPSRGRCSTRRSSRWCCRMRAPATASARR